MLYIYLSYVAAVWIPKILCFVFITSDINALLSILVMFVIGSVLFIEIRY